MLDEKLGNDPSSLFNGNHYPSSYTMVLRDYHSIIPMLPWYNYFILYLQYGARTGFQEIKKISISIVLVSVGRASLAQLCQLYIRCK